MASSTTAALRIIFGADTEQMDKALGHLQAKLRKTGKSLTKAGKTMSVAVTAPLAAIGATSFRTAARFEQSMARVKAVSGATGAEFQLLQKQALDLGRSTIFTASNVADLQLEFSKLGFTAEQITKVTESTLYLAQATGSDLATAAEVAGATLRGFGLSAEETQRVTDVMAASFSSSALDMTSFRESMKYVAPVAKAAGVSLEETTAMLGALANSGIKGSQAGTALRRIFSQLAGDGGDVSAEIEKLAKKGLNLADAKDEVGRSAQTALLVLSESIPVTEDLTKSLQLAEGSAADMADTMNQTSEGALARMNSALEGASIVIGDALAPHVNRLAKFIEELSNGFTDLGKGTQVTIIVIGALVASIGPLLLIAGQMAFALANLAPAFAFVIAKVHALNAAIMANPWGAAVVALMALGAAIAYYSRGQKEVITNEDKLNDLRAKGQKSADQEIAQVRSLVEQYKKYEEGSAERVAIMEELQQIAPQHFSDLDAETTKVKDLQAAYTEYAKAARKAAVEKVFSEELANLNEQIIKSERLLNEMTNGGLTFEGGKIFRQGIMGKELIDDKEIERLLNLNALTEAGRAELEAIGGEFGISLISGYYSTQDMLEKVHAEMATMMGGIQVDPDPSGKGKEGAAALGKAYNEFKLEGDDVSKTLDGLSTTLGNIQGKLAISTETGAAAQAARDMEAAYRKAAETMAGLGELELADQLLDDANAAKEQAKALGEAEAAGFEFDSQLHGIIVSSGLAAVGINDLLGSLERFDGKVDTSTGKLEETKDAFTSFSEQVVEAVLSFFDAFAQNLGNAVEQAVRSGEALQPVGELVAGAAASVLATLGQIAIQVGKTAIMTGTAVEGIKKALQTLNPVLAIAAGIALIALAGAVRGKLAKASDARANVPKLARGGITKSETLALVGDNPSGKEAIIPFERMGEFLRMAAPAQEVIVTGRISGQDLLLSNQRSHIDRTRNTGH